MSDSENKPEATEADAEEFVVDEGYVDGVYHELATLSVSLDPNPLDFGPRRLSEKIAKTRHMMDRCEQVFIQVSYDCHRFKRAQLILDVSLKLEINRLLAEDPETRAGRSLRDREAIARLKLSEDVAHLNNLEGGIAQFVDLIVVIKAKRTSLSGTGQALKDQIRLCRDEIIHLHGKWGSRVPGAPPLNPGLSVGGGGADEVTADLLHRAEAAIEAVRKEGGWEDPEPFDLKAGLSVPGVVAESPAQPMKDEDAGGLDLAALVFAAVEPEEVPELDPPSASTPPEILIHPLVKVTQVDLETSAKPEEVDSFFGGEDDDDGLPEAVVVVVEEEEDLEDLISGFL